MNALRYLGYIGIAITYGSWIAFIILSHRNQKTWEQMQKMASLVEPNEYGYLSNHRALQVPPRRFAK